MMNTREEAEEMLRSYEAQVAAVEARSRSSKLSAAEIRDLDRDAAALDSKGEQFTWATTQPLGRGEDPMPLPSWAPEIILAAQRVQSRAAAVASACRERRLTD
jgi:hypothetical protein